MADSDKDYLDSLAAYLRSSSGGGFQTVAFSTEEAFRQYLQAQDGQQEIFLVGPGFCEMVKGRSQSPVVLLSPLRSCQSIEEEDRIFKYQSGEVIARELHRRISGEQQGKDVLRFGRRTRTIAVYSPLGGSGKTAVALGASIISSWAGKKVFYLNLESLSSTRGFLTGDRQEGLSHVLYYIKEAKGNLARKLERAKSSDPLYKIDFYLPPVSAFDLTEGMAAQVRALLDSLRNSRQYDLIIADLETGFHSTNLGVLEEADDILILAVQSELVREKLIVLEKQLLLLERGKAGSVLDKARLVLNKTEDTAGELDKITFYGKFVYHSIPYVEGLLVPRGEGLWRFDLNSPFAAALRELVNKLNRGQ